MEKLDFQNKLTEINSIKIDNKDKQLNEDNKLKQIKQKKDLAEELIKIEPRKMNKIIFLDTILKIIELNK